VEKLEDWQTESSLVCVGKAAVVDNVQVQTDTVLSLRAGTELGAAQSVHYALHCPLQRKQTLSVAYRSVIQDCATVRQMAALTCNKETKLLHAASIHIGRILFESCRNTSPTLTGF